MQVRILPWALRCNELGPPIADGPNARNPCWYPVGTLQAVAAASLRTPSLRSRSSMMS